METKSVSVFLSSKKFLVLSVFLLSSSAVADVSPLCNDLARFACAPGSYKDGTGEIKSESEISRFMASYAEKSRADLHDRFQKILSDPSNSYFKEVALASMGLKNSPQCNSTAPDDVSACRENLIDGLTTIAQKQALGALMPRTGLERPGNLRELNFITQNNVFQKVIQELNGRAQKDLAKPELSKKIRDEIFPKIKELIVARLKDLSIPEDKKNFMIGKVNSIMFDGTTCEEMGGGFGGSNNGEVVSALIVPNAFYDPMRNIFKLCSGFLLQSTSEFQIADTIAHELMHSIDPCFIGHGPSDLGFKYSNQTDLKKMEQEYPIKNVIQCLRDDRSVGARNFNSEESQIRSLPPPIPMPAGPSGGYGGGLGAPPTKESKKASFCLRDQIGESVADWMAAEVLPIYMEQNHKLTTEQYRNGYANALRLICQIEQDPNVSFTLDVHPAMEKRINKILLMNPKIRKQMGCPEKHPENVYCDPERPIDSPPVEAPMPGVQLPAGPGRGVR